MRSLRSLFPRTRIVDAHCDIPCGVYDPEQARKLLSELSGKEIREDAGISIKPISVTGTKRIVRAGFDYAVKMGRKKVTAVHKANIMKLSDGLFLDCTRKVGREFPEIQYEEVIVDNMCMQLVKDPTRYDVLVMENLYGDILSDLCAGLVGGLGLVPGANIGERTAMFEAVHGTAPDIAGKNIANPGALVLASCLMLDHIGDHERASRVRKAFTDTVRAGKTVTRDLGGTASTTEFTDAVIAAL